MEEIETWHVLKEFPRFEISDDQEIRKRALMRVSTVQYYDDEGNLVDEAVSTTYPKAKILNPTEIDGGKRYSFRKNGKLYGRMIHRLYKTEVEGIKNPWDKTNDENGKPIKLRF